MDKILAPFLASTQNYSKPADREAFRKIHSKWKYLRHFNDCDCIEQWILEPVHLVLYAIFRETTDETEILHDIKRTMKWKMTSLPSKKRRVMEHPIMANIKSYLPKSNYEQLKWLYFNACHIFRQQGWELDMSKLPCEHMEIDDLHDVYAPGAHMVLAVLFNDIDASIVVKNLEQMIIRGQVYADHETNWDFWSV
jgi:hypothetical protein